MASIPEGGEENPEEATPEPSEHSDTGLAAYELGGVVGHGLAGILIQARHLPTDTRVLLEKFPPELARDHAFVRRLAASARLAVSLESPWTVSVFDLLREGSDLYLVGEAPQGSSLATVGAQRTDIPAVSSVAVCSDLLGGLEAAHALGLRHGALTAETAIVTPAGVARLTGFGVGAALKPDASVGVDLAALARVGNELLLRAPVGGVPSSITLVLRQASRGIRHYPSAAEFRNALLNAAGTEWGENWRRESDLAERSQRAPRTPPGEGLRAAPSLIDEPRSPSKAGEPVVTEIAVPTADAEVQITPELEPEAMASDGMPVPPAAAPRRRKSRRPRLTLVLALCVAAVVIGAVGGVVYALRTAGPPPDTGPVHLTGPLTLTADPLKGGCGGTQGTIFTFTATGPVAGVGNLVFQWERNGAAGAQQTIPISSTVGSFSAKQLWLFQGSQTATGTMVFHLLQPVDQKSSQQVTYACP